MSKFIVNDDRVIIDGEDVSEYVSEIVITMENGLEIKRRPASAAAQQLGRILESLVKLAHAEVNAPKVGA